MTYSDVLLIEDDAVLGGALRQRLALEDISVQWVLNCAQAIELLRRTRLHPAFVLADIRLPDGSGEDLYRRLVPYLSRTTVVFATAYGDIAQAVRLVAAGANDYLTKPYDADALVARIRVAIGRFGDPERPAAVQGNPFASSLRTADTANAIERLASAEMHVLLEGETGVGKDLAARYMHARSPRGGGPFLAINGAELNDALAETQWFGHVRGALGAPAATRDGVFAQAAGGTLYLDEVGELPPRAQSLLLRVLESAGYRPVGAPDALPVDCRVVASTNADLGAAVAQGRFRADLYYRLAAGRIILPALRERPDDIPVLAVRFLQEQRGSGRTRASGYTDAALAALAEYAWPGNVRELKNRVARAAVMSDAPQLDASDLFPERLLQDAGAADLAAVRQDAEWRGIQRAISASGGHLGHAAKRLGISRTTLWKKIRQARGKQEG